MELFSLARLVIASLLAFAIVLYSISKFKSKKHIFTAAFMARTGIFSAISILLYVVPFLKFPLPIFPSFLEFHFDEVPILIAGFAYGPICATLITIIKFIVKLPLTTSLGVGEIADVIYSLFFVIPASLIYQKKRNVKGAIIAIIVGVISQSISASLITSFAILDFYMFVMGIPEDALLAMCQQANPSITSLGWTFFFMIGLPFNLIKDVVVAIITFLLYKQTHKLFDKIGHKKTRG